ncbi:MULTISPECIES: DUF4097 family beta strand repeat-containing protein [Actinoalloteichus]|uniref:Adhesin n=1 Tax=Actinoalloteichus caeruleus DSM 43889 TaxID=1120930 RepID=A0ABT1JED9_ACTCY|nr:DUF4097 family beta strand repeat-containing protein [Actinoalloteichus caeruleus]MCP2330864.1 putative adhesin [Actinoalloteichus caeruleus DSM 43889]
MGHKAAPPVMAIALVAAAAVSAGCSPTTNQETLTSSHEFPLTGERLIVEVVGSAVELRESDVDSVSFDQYLGGAAASEGNASWTVERDSLLVETTCTGFTPGCSGRYAITVPVGTAIELTGRGRSVTVTGLTGPVTASLDNGTIDVSDTSGDLDLAARSGHIRTDNTSGSLRASITTNHMEIRNARGPLDLSSESGNLVVRGIRSPEVTTNTRSGDARLVFAEAPRRVRATSAGSGDVHVALPSGQETYQVVTEARRLESDVDHDPASDRLISVAGSTVRLTRDA